MVSLRDPRYNMNEFRTGRVPKQVARTGMLYVIPFVLTWIFPFVWFMIATLQLKGVIAIQDESLLARLTFSMHI